MCYVVFVFFFLKMKRMTPSFIFKLSVAPSEVFPPSWNSACRWYSQRASWDCSWLGAGSWAQRTFSIKPVYSGPTVGKAANCSFVGNGEFTIGCLFLDGRSKEAKWPLFPQPRTRIQELCLLPPTLPQTGPGPFGPPSWSAKPSVTQLLSLQIGGGQINLWAVSHFWKTFENPRSCRKAGYIYGLGIGTKVRGTSLSWMEVCGVLCRRLRVIRIPLISSLSSQDLGPVFGMLPQAAKAYKPYFVPIF